MQPSQPKQLTPDEVQAKLERGEEIFVVDVRTPREYQQRHIPDAILLPTDEFADRFRRDLNEDDEIVVVCEHGVRSAAAAGFLISQGFENVSDMVGGMSRYAGPTVKDT